MRTLAKGAFSGITEATQRIIKDRETWGQLWARHSGFRSPPEPIPAVNFDKEMVIVVTLGRQRTGGYAIEITRVQADGKHLKIFVKRSAPPPGAMTIQALTAPFLMVAIPRSGLPPEFVATKPDE